MKEFFKKNRKFSAIYLVWFFTHVAFLLVGSTNSESSYKEDFWPFYNNYNCSLPKCYDLSEFLVYAIGPAILIIAYFMFTKKD